MRELNGEADEFAGCVSSADTLHAWFTLQAARNPEATALTVGACSVSYGELLELGRCTAARLVAAGTRPGDLVPVCVSRSRVVPAILGVLMAGAAYVPLDPRYPDVRLGDLIEQVGAAVVVTDDEHVDRLKALHDGEFVHTATAPDRDRPPVDLAVDPDDLAYVMFTSGSTGTPKGVKITHRNVTRLMAGTAGLYGLCADDVWTMLHSYAFDFSVWEIWGALLFGGRLVVVEDDVARAPDELLALLERESVTILSQTPSALAALIGAEAQAPAELAALRLVVLGGERLDPATLSGWFARRGDVRPRIVNMYGITETTVHVTHCAITAQDAAAGSGSPIGAALPDLDISLRNENGELVAPGETGEIWISGPGLAVGYHGDDDTTARAFRTTAWGPGDHRRSYRSGDLARLGADGRFYYAGRRDEQVKVRGYRIELGEVAAALKAHPDVTDAIVSTDTGESVGSRLLAWVTVRPGGPAADALRAFLTGRLPGHMVPGGVTVLGAMPLTPNGKADRRALLERARSAQREASAPEPDGRLADPLEATVAAIWAEELGVAEVTSRDDFFALGGHSLMVMKLITRTREEARSNVPARALFEAPVLADFVERVRAAAAGPGHRR